MYDFRLMVELPNGKRACAAFKVESEMALNRCLDPMDVCTDDLTAMAVGGSTIERAARVTHDREMLARHIANRLTIAILDSLSEQDTVNGYPKQKGEG
jgi:hypothetical protein